MSQKTCFICGKKIRPFVGKYTCQDGYICKPCFASKGYLLNVVKQRGIVSVRNLTLKQIDAINEDVKNSLAIAKDFHATYVPDPQIQFDDDNDILILSEYGHLHYKPEKYRAIRYNQIVSYELIENGASIASGGLGRAAVGGLLFGGAGAVVGASTRKQHAECTGLYIKLTVNDSAQPSVLLHILGNAKTDGLIYNNLRIICPKNLNRLQ